MMMTSLKSDQLVKYHRLFFLPLVLMATAVEAQDSAPPVIDPELYLHQADAAVREGRLTQAGQMIAWLEHNGGAVSSDDIALLKAEYAIAGQDAAAASVALAAVQSPVRNICRLETAKGWVAANADALDKAIVAFAKAVRACPEDAGAWNLLGLAFIGKGEANAAGEAFGRALALTPNNPEILNNHALALAQKGQLEDALQQLGQAAAFDQGNRTIQANWDYVSGMMGHMPPRHPQDGDAAWSARLINIAKGAKAASRTPQANALFSRALLTLDHFDKAVWSEITPPKENQP
jgi:Flp pilus assembly protein TadD